MQWTDITKDWELWSPLMRARFPYLETRAMNRARHDRGTFEAYLARSHNLSLNEAREEIEDFLYVETLASELVPPQRAHNLQ